MSLMVSFLPKYKSRIISMPMTRVMEIIMVAMILLPSLLLINAMIPAPLDFSEESVIFFYEISMVNGHRRGSGVYT